MAIYDPIVPRPKDGSRRNSGNLPDSLQRALYQEMLTEELGRCPEGFTPAAPQREWRDLVPAIAVMIVLAMVALAIAYVAILWRAGEFDSWATGRTTTEAQRVWQRADRMRAPEETAPIESEVDKMLAPPPKAVEEGETEGEE